MVANKVLTIRLTTNQYERLILFSERKGYLQLAPFIRGLIEKYEKEE